MTDSLVVTRIPYNNTTGVQTRTQGRIVADWTVLGRKEKLERAIGLKYKHLYTGARIHGVCVCVCVWRN